MTSFRNSFVMVGGLALLGSVGTMMNHYRGPASLQADAGGPKVTIENPLPLPVTGNVGISGTPNVNVNNTPNVKVTNTAASPVPTRNVDNPDLQPFQFSESGPEMNFKFPVPAGKILLMEQISMSCGEPAGQVIHTDFRVFTFVNGVFGVYFFAPREVGSSLVTVLIADEKTHIYASGGTNVQIGVGFGSPAGSVCTASVSGHLLNAQ